MTLGTRNLILVLGDQLSRNLAGLKDADPARDTIVMAEVMDEATYVPHHPQKIILIFAAMRHFAKNLEDEGFSVIYLRLDAPGNPQSITKALKQALNQALFDGLIITKPSEFRLLRELIEFAEGYKAQNDNGFTIGGFTIGFREDDRFLCSEDEFAAFAGGKSSLRLSILQIYAQKNRPIDGVSRSAGGWAMEL